MTAYMPEHRAGHTARHALQHVLPGALLRAAALAVLLAFSSIAVAGAQEGTPVATPSASPTPSPSMPRLELDLEELNDSGITGTATLFDAGDQTIVEFDVEGAGGGHPAHIHAGVCGELNPEPAYSLENVDENGKSTTVVDVTLDDLLTEDYAIDMHLATNELGTLIACANIDGEPELPEGATPEATPSASVGGITPTETPIATATETSDGTGGAVSTETPVATEVATEAATEVATSSTTPAPTAAPTEATTPAPSLPEGQGGSSDGTGGAGAAVPIPSQSTTIAGVSDGTAGVSGKGQPVSASTLPQQAGVGSALIWPDSPAMAMIWASSAAAILLGASAWIVRRGEHSYMTTPSRWTRMGL